MNPPASWTPIYIDQHAMLVGTTGSGKSTRMVRELAYRVARLRQMHMSGRVYKIYLVDTKQVSLGQSDSLGHYAWMGGKVYRDWRDIDPRATNAQLIIYRPKPELMEPAVFGEFFERLRTYQYRSAETGELSALPFLIIIDELGDVLGDERQRAHYIESFTKILTGGRSAAQTLWICTQFPVYIDPAIKRNVGARFCFRLPDENDRRTMAGVFGDRRMVKPILTPHGFWYQNEKIVPTLERAVLFDGMEGTRRAVSTTA